MSFAQKTRIPSFQILEETPDDYGAATAAAISEIYNDDGEDELDDRKVKQMEQQYEGWQLRHAQREE